MKSSKINDNNLTTKEDVLASLRQNWDPPLFTEIIPTTEALGRIAAKDYTSLNCLPKIRSAVMDGYAVKSKDFKGGDPPDTSKWKLGKNYIKADMGDDFDDAFDAVILVEEVDFSSGQPFFSPLSPVVPGLNVRSAGSQINLGDPLVKKFRPLLPKDLAMLQMGGVAMLEVIKKPLVGFIPTGAELINPGEPVTRGANIDTNSILVQNTLKALGADFLKFPIITDKRDLLEEALDQALAMADIVVLNGGSSKGGDDLNSKILADKAKLLLAGVAAAPGKPMGIYMAGNKPVVNLPGPMIAAYYGLEWCLNFLLARWLRQPVVPRAKIKAVLTGPINAPNNLSFLINLKVTPKGDGTFLAKPLDPRSVRTYEGIDANAQFMTQIGHGSLRQGEAIVCEVLRAEELLG
ncbi:MAG: molybdopterin molybdenumtransferase MoeA [Deltaproteobacteria bacterium]|jgi:molybdopterin molybdotransferase/putative molybdopterin biosynthesis protein|nr:molybdopterin molybdenumtransferase MoeA [Deltaproteobacteria bacterium]